MAQLSKTVLGKVSGTLGDITFRQRNGKNVIGMRPRHYAPPDDDGSVGRRARFALSAKLAQGVLYVPELLALWTPQTPAGMSTFNYIIQKNVLVLNPGSVSGLTVITPNGGFIVNCTSSAVSSDSIAVELAAIGSVWGIDLAKEPNAKLAYVLSLTNPTNETYPDVWFVAGASEPKPLVLNAPLTFNIALSGQDGVSVESYGDKKLLIALVTLDADGNAVRGSETVMR